MAGKRLQPAKLHGSFGGSKKGYGELQGMGNKVGSELSRVLNSIFDQFEAQDVSEQIMYDAMMPTFEKSQRYTPKLTGALRESGYLEKVGTKSKPAVVIGYGKGGHPDYTVYVHEMVGIPHREPTRAKFLQSAVMEDLDLIFERLGEGYKRFMGD